MDALDTFLSGIFSGNTSSVPAQGVGPDVSAPSPAPASQPEGFSPEPDPARSGGSLPSSGFSPHMLLRQILTGSNEPIIDHVKTALWRQPGGPGDMPPMARGTATAAPDVAPSSGIPSMPVPQGAGRAIGTMPAPMNGPRPGDGGSLRPSVGVGSVPAAAAAAPAIGGWSTSTTPEQQGIMATLAGLKNNPTATTLVDILNGAMRGAAMNVNNPRGMGIGAFGAGYTSAQDHLNKREKEKAAAELAKQKVQFDQALRVRDDARKERGANRSDEELGIKRDDSARKRAETDARIKKFNAEADKAAGKGLSPQNVVNLENLIQKHKSEMRLAGSSQEEINRADASMRSRLQRQIDTRKLELQPQTSIAPPSPGQIMNGYRFKGGNPSDPTSWEKQ